ncbi:JmjC domain-containing protein [Streptomyces cadmiisoli]|uniref:JmjC domain-containing protein n=1 Tax=Streptomyces cadmiisoli TaxID=2184053 RepID=A0A2Z4JES7_9ACTN|nr:cupin domain-containing protein [Streptomyces cadmiisoli]AWW43501.1 hypothetical protein DN051_43980 [Streptomyces cadmiisoli]
MFDAMSEVINSPSTFKENPPTVPTVWRSTENNLRQIIGIENLVDILDGVVHAKDNVRITIDGDTIDSGAYTAARTEGGSFAGEVLPIQVAKYLEKGASLVINNLERHWRPLRDYHRRLTHEIGTGIECVGFLTPPKERGFRPHYDQLDVLICQVSGHKTWRLYKPVVENPLIGDNPPAGADLSGYISNEQPFLEIELGPGERLWIPRGWVHVGFSGRNEYSWHVSLVFCDYTHKWLALEIIKALATSVDESFLRSLLPRGVASDRDLLNVSVRAVVERIIETLPTLDFDHVVHSVQRQMRTTLPSVPRPLTDVHIGPDTWLQIVPESILATSRRNDGKLDLQLSRGKLTINESAADFFSRILEAGDGDRRWLSTDLAPQVGVESAIEVAKKLYKAGVARVL